MDTSENFLRDDSPYSTMRIAAIFIIGLFIPYFVYVWVVVSLKTLSVAVIPDSVSWLMGVVLGAKTLQKGIEVIPDVITAIKTPPPTTVPEPPLLDENGNPIT